MAIDPQKIPEEPRDSGLTLSSSQRAFPFETSAAHVDLQHAIRSLRSAPPSHRRRVVMDFQADVTVSSVLKKFADLREAVACFARFLRDQGVPPERMLPQVKTAVSDVIISEGWRDRTVEQLVMENVVRWAIDAYYQD